MPSFELRYADGRSVTNIRPAYAPHARRDEPTTNDTQRAHTTASRPSFWVTPLPPLGALTISCTWAAAGIPATQHTLDAQDILDAVHQSDERKSRASQAGREQATSADAPPHLQHNSTRQLPSQQSQFPS
jgi:hypothetical protein